MPKQQISADAARTTRRRLNARFLGISLAVFIAIAVCMYFLNVYQVKASARRIRDRAETLQSEGNAKQAAQYLRQYIGFAPDDVEALISLADMLEKSASDPREQFDLFLLYERILRQQPQNNDIRRKLVQLAMRFQRLDDARLHLNELLRSNPNDGELEFLYAQCEQLSEKYDAAAERCQAAMRKGYLKTDVFMTNALLLRNHLKQPKEADALIERMVQENPQAYEAYLGRASYRLQFGSLADAVKDAAQAAVLAPDRTEPILMMAQLLSSSTSSTAEEIQATLMKIEQAVQRDPKNASLYQSLSQLEMKAGNQEKALAALRRGQEQLPNQYELALLLADLLISNGRTQEAEREMAKLRELKSADFLVEYLEARLMMQRGELLPASRQLQRIATQPALTPVFRNMVRLQLGECHKRMANFEAQLTEFQAVLESDPHSVEARLGAAQAHHSLGHIDAALEQYRQLMSFPRVPLQVANLLYERNFRLPAERQDWQEIDQILREAAKNPASAVDAGILQASVNQARGRNDDARAIFNELQRANPKQADLWASQTRLAIQREDWNQALALLDEAKKQMGDTATVRLTTSLYWAARGGEESRPALDKLAEGNDSFTPADRIRLLDGLANVRLSLGHLKEAMALWSQVAQLQPDNVRSHFRVYSLALSLDDKAAAAKAAAELRRLEGADGPHVLMSEALELIARAQAGESSAADQARSILARVATQRPGWEMVPMNQARLDEITGDTESAIVNYRRAIDVGSRDPAVLKRIVVLLLAKNRFDDAEQFVRTIRGDTPAALTKEIRRLIAESSLKSLDFDQAQAMARELVSPDSRDSLEQIWFGQMMAATGRLDEGQRALEKAVQLDPAKPGAWVSLVLFLARTNKFKEAEAAIEKARQSIPADKVGLSLALCYEAIRRGDDAEKSYLAAIAANPTDEGLSQNLAAFYLRTGQTQKAEPLLRSLMSPERKSSPAGIAWARRTLAAAIAPIDYPHYQEAIRLLNKAKPQTSDSAADARVLARVLLTRPTTEHLAQAMQIFENLETSGKLMPAEQLLMAQACDAAGLTEKADKRWAAVVSANEGNSLILSAYLARQLRNQNYDDARKWLSQLKQKEPNSFITLELAAQLMLIDKKLPDVLQALTTYTETENPLVKERKDRIRQVVGLLVALAGQPKLDETERKLLETETETWYRKLVTVAPDTSLSLAVFLGGRGKTPEAIDLCEQAVKSGQILEATTASLSILRNSDKDEKWMRRVEQWMQDAIRRSPNSSASLIQLAELNDLRGKYKDAAAIDREVLKLAPRNVVALNNLAWLLAIDQGQPEEAVRLINSAIEMAGPLPTLIDTRGTVLLKKGETEKAIADFEDSLKQADVPMTRFHLAEAHWRSRNAQLAKSNLDKAVAAGLKPAQLHPLERPSYDAMMKELVKN